MWEGGCTQFVHGRSRITIDPRIPFMPGRSTSGFHQPGRGGVEGLGVCGGVGGCTQFVHGRSRINIDPRIPTTPGRSTSGFHRPGRHRVHQARSAVRRSASVA